jgi:putative tryptophan/tyrosine transport system substrate-binding protein
MRPTIPDIQPAITALQAAARTLGLQLVVENARTDGDLETAFETFLERQVGAVLVGNSAFYVSRREQLVALAAHRALPAMYPSREDALAGGLMSYGSNGSSLVDLLHSLFFGLPLGQRLSAVRAIYAYY